MKTLFSLLLVMCSLLATSQVTMTATNSDATITFNGFDGPNKKMFFTVVNKQPCSVAFFIYVNNDPTLQMVNMLPNQTLEVVVNHNPSTTVDVYMVTTRCNGLPGSLLQLKTLPLTPVRFTGFEVHKVQGGFEVSFTAAEFSASPSFNIQVSRDGKTFKTVKVTGVVTPNVPYKAFISNDLLNN